MGTPYPLEKKNQILGRILSKEITVEQAHREYSIATSCVYRWLQQLKVDSRSGGQGTQAIPLPQGMNFRAALVAEGYCQEVGFESPAAGTQSVTNFFNTIQGTLQTVSLVVVTISVMWAGFRVLFMGNAFQEVAKPLLGGIMIGSAGWIASLFVG